MTSTILITVCRNGNMLRAREILNSTQDLTQEELNEALGSATFGRLEESRADIVGLLLAHGAEITQLAFAGFTSNFDTSVLQQFLDHGWDIDSTDLTGKPAIAHAVRDETCLRWLLEKGANPSTRCHSGSTALESAALENTTIIASILLSYGAELDPEALRAAISCRGQGGLPMMKFLIERGISINGPIKRFGTPLFYAVTQGRKDRVQLLLDKRADRTIKTQEMMPADKAKECQEPEIFDMLSY